MKILTTKSEITVKNLQQDCDYKGHRIGIDDNLYISGSHFNPGVDYYETIKELRESFL